MDSRKRLEDGLNLCCQSGGSSNQLKHSGWDKSEGQNGEIKEAKASENAGSGIEKGSAGKIEKGG